MKPNLIFSVGVTIFTFISIIDGLMLELERECPRGEKAYSLAHMSGSRRSAGEFVMPRCEKFQHEGCVQDCEWSSTCRNAAGWKDDLGTHTFVTGFRTVEYLSFDSASVTIGQVRCCKSRAITVFTCEWHTVPRSNRTVGIRQFARGKSAVIRDVRSAMSKNDGLIRFEVEVCQVRSDFCFIHYRQSLNLRKAPSVALSSAQRRQRQEEGQADHFAAVLREVQTSRNVQKFLRIQEDRLKELREKSRSQSGRSTDEQSREPIYFPPYPKVEEAGRNREPLIGFGIGLPFLEPEFEGGEDLACEPLIVTSRSERKAPLIHPQSAAPAGLKTSVLCPKRPVPQRRLKDSPLVKPGLSTRGNLAFLEFLHPMHDASSEADGKPKPKPAEKASKTAKRLSSQSRNQSTQNQSTQEHAVNQSTQAHENISINQNRNNGEYSDRSKQKRNRHLPSSLDYSESMKIRCSEGGNWEIYDGMPLEINCP